MHLRRSLGVLLVGSILGASVPAGLIAALPLIAAAAVSGPSSKSSHTDRESSVHYRATREGLVLSNGAKGRKALSKLPTSVTVLQQERKLAATATVGGSWTNLGPSPLNTGALYHFSQASGRVLALAYAPTSPGTIYLGGADGGVWRATSGGVVWTPLTDNMPSLAIGALAVDPNNSGIIFAGTGEISGGAPNPGTVTGSLYGVGIMKYTSTDGAWHLYGDTVFRSEAISAIRVDPTDSSRVFAGVVNKDSCVYNTPPCTTVRGVAISINGGLDWSKPTGPGSIGAHDVTDLAIDNAGNLYAAVGGRSDAANGVYYSTDHGKNWSNASPSGVGSSWIWKISLAPTTMGNPRSSQILYALAGGSTGGTVQGILQTSNGGTTWSPLSTSGAICGTQSYYSPYVAVDPSNANIVYVGLTDVYKSTNGGGPLPTVWTNLTGGFDASCNYHDPPAESIHVDQHAILFIPGGSTTLFANDGGVYSSTNGGSTFTSLNGNLGLTQFYGGDLSRTNAGTILGGTQDNGIVVTGNGGGTWNQSREGDGFYAAIDSTISTNMYGEYTYGWPFRNKQSGTPGQWTSQAPNAMFSDPALFAAPLVMDPSSASTIYSGHAKLWKTVNGEDTWTIIDAPPSHLTFSDPQTNPCVFWNGTVWTRTSADCIMQIAVAPSSASVIYISDPIGETWVTTNGGTNWMSLDGTDCSPSNQSPFWCTPRGASITGLAVDPTDPQIVYATANSFSTTGTQQYHVFRSVNQGMTWQDISAALPNEPFQSIAVNPVNHTTVYAGADIGVYTSSDSGSTWSVLGTGLPNVSVYQLVPNHSGTELTAFTYGRGIWKISVPAPDVYAAGAIGTDGGLWSIHSAVSGFTAMGGGFIGAPAVAAVPQTVGPSVALFIGTGLDHNLWVRNSVTGWQPLTNAAVYCIDSPAAAIIGGTLYVACQASSHDLWHAEGPAPTGTNLPQLNITAWHGLGGIIKAGPAIASVNGTVTYFVVGSDDHVWTRGLVAGYAQMPWTCSGHPAAATSGTTSYFACDSLNGSLVYSSNSGSGWSALQSLGGVLVDGPGIAFVASGPIFFVEGTGGTIWHRTVAGPWTRDGGQVNNGVGATAL